MILQSLNIERQPSWAGKDAGKLTGNIKFVTTNAETTLQLSEEKARAIIAIVSEQLIENAKEIGAGMLAESIPARLV